MDEGRKTQRRNAYITGAVLLVVILLVIMIYQIVAISVKNRDLDELQDKIAYYKELTAEGEDEIAIKETYEWIVLRAREMGYRFDGDKLYKD